MTSTNRQQLTTDIDGSRVWWCRCAECLFAAALLAVAAVLIGLATAPAVAAPTDLAGFERYLFIWLVLDLFVLTLLAITTTSADRPQA